MSEFRLMRWLSDEAVSRLKRAADWPDVSETRYKVLEEIGRGGMGTVYLAEDSVLERAVALKVLSLEGSEPSERERMLREARVMAGLEHPGIVPVHDAGILPDGRVFYAMKLVRGERLDRYAGTGPALADRLRVFLKACDAVAFAHAHGILHRDLKPENLMIGAFGEVLVLDWGVARRAGDPAEPGGTVLGTRAYMAPEQSAGRTDLVDERADVYALGAILEFLLVRGAGAPALRPLRAIARKAMAPAAEERYRAVEELAADVSRYLDGQAPSAYHETPWERVARFFVRYRTPILLILAYLAMRAFLILWFHR